MVTDVLFARDRGAISDPEAAGQIISDAVAEVVKRQVGAAIDVGSRPWGKRDSSMHRIAQECSP
jgi:hypothetical protein